MSMLEASAIGFAFNLIDGLFVSVFIVLIYNRKFRPRPVLINTMTLAVLFVIGSRLLFAVSDIVYIILIVVVTILSIGMIGKAAFNLKLLRGMVVSALVCSVKMVTIIISFLVMSLVGLEINSIETSRKVLVYFYVFGVVVDLVFILLLYYLKPVFNLLKNLGNRSNLFISVHAVLILVMLSVNVAHIYRPYSTQRVKYEIIALITLVFLVYFAIGLKHLTRLSMLEHINQELEYQKFYNRTLYKLIDDLGRFKHGYDNTLASIRGYIELRDWKGLSKFADELIEEKNKVNTAESLMLSKVKNAGIMGVLVSKCEYAGQNKVNIKIMVSDEITEVKMKISELCEVIGILLDNAIEAASCSSEKFVRLNISNSGEDMVFSFENSVDKKPDIARMSIKGWSTKGKERGFGLWMVKNIISKYSNVILNTQADECRMKQDLIIS